MKKILKIFLIMIMFMAMPVFAEEQSTIIKEPEIVITEETVKEPIIIKSVQAETKDKKVQLRETEGLDIIFNELNQTATYTVKLENTSDEVLYVNDLEVENLSEEFISFSLSPKSVNEKIEPGKSKEIEVIVKTLDISQAGRNVSDDVTLKFILSREIVKNPETGSNWIVYLILVITLFITISTVFSKVNKKKKLSLIMVGLLCGTLAVSANDSITVSLTGKVTYISQNTMQESGVSLYKYQAIYTNATDIWKYSDKVKNIIISDNKIKPEEYEYRYDLSSNNSKRIYGYLVENKDEKIPYDLYIVADGIIYAPENATGLFAFPNVDTINGLEFIEFENTKNMTAMFYNNENLKSANVKSIDTSNATNTSYMFNGCDKLNVSEKDFNLEKVTNKNYMFNKNLGDIVKANAKSDKDINFASSPTTGKYFIESTKNDKNPIYYYRGAVTNNNVLFAGLCWKMVRTTDTGGVKLVYNGELKDAYENFTSLTSSQYTIVANSSESPYNYNTSTLKWESTNKSHNSKSNITFNIKTPGNYILTYDISSEKNYDWAWFYKNGSLLKQVSGIENGTIDLGQLTTSDSIRVKYTKDVSVNSGDDSVAFYVASGTIVSPSICDNTGSDSQIGTSKFNEKYLSPSDVGYMYGTSYDAATKELLNDSSSYYYGSDVIWDGTKYTLTSSIESSDYFADKSSLATKHYTCFNSTGICNDVYYITTYLESSKKLYYLTFKNGKTLNTAKEEMFSNTTDSTIKSLIDNWYAENIIGYSSKLEDTIWHNEKNIYSGSLLSKDTKTANSMFSPHLRNSKSFEPSINTEYMIGAFTVSNSRGNKKLQYPIGMLTADEYTLAGNGTTGYSNKTYLNSGSTVWTLSPYRFGGSDSKVYAISADGSISSSYVTTKNGVRPAISLKAGIDYVFGTGSSSDPYVIE